MCGDRCRRPSPAVVCPPARRCVRREGCRAISNHPVHREETAMNLFKNMPLGQKIEWLGTIASIAVLAAGFWFLRAAITPTPKEQDWYHPKRTFSANDTEITEPESESE